MKANDCINCRKPTELLPKYDSEAAVGWVHCDECGKVSKPVNLGDGRDKIIAQWNAENPKR